MDDRERATQSSGTAAPKEALDPSIRDGRSERGARNRQAILEAVYDLIQREERTPTAERAAEQAGVGIRTVFRHFKDMDALYAEVYIRVIEDIREFVELPLAQGTLDDRCRTLIERRCEMFDRIAPVRRAFSAQRNQSKMLGQLNESTINALRMRLYGTFPELEGAAPALTEALDLLSSFEAWNRLKVEQGLSNFEVRICLEAAFTSLMREAIQ